MTIGCGHSIFSVLERQYILQIVKKHPVIDYDEGPPDQTLDPYYVNRPEKYRDVILPTNWYIVRSNRKPRSQHKNHGIISFQDLSNMIVDAWKTVIPEVKAYCSLIAGNELTRYREEQKAFKEKYGEAAYEQHARKRKKQKSVDDRGKKKRRCDDDDNISDCLEDDGLKQDDVAAAAIKDDELTAQEQEQQQAPQNISRSMETRSIDGLTGLSGAVAQNQIMTQRIRSIREEQERFARAMCIRELQTRRIQDSNNLTSSGVVQDPHLAHEIGLANIVYQENQRLTQILNQNQAILNSRLMMLRQQQQQQQQTPLLTGLMNEELMRIRDAQVQSRNLSHLRGDTLQAAAVGATLLQSQRLLRDVTPEELMRIREIEIATAVATLPQLRNHDQHQAHTERLIQPAVRTGLSEEAIEGNSRSVLNQGLAMLQQQARREQMLQSSAPAEPSREASEDLMSMRNLQARNAIQSPHQQQQALQGQLIQPSGLVGVSRQVIAEQLIRVRNAELDAADATMRESTRIRDSRTTAAGASSVQSRDHNLQQAHQEGMNQRTAPTDHSSDVTSEQTMRIAEGQASTAGAAALQSSTTKMKK
eukprot:scaffold6056_cov71-Cyclotella_meneghiniana.AAC.3